jgi:indolepyruvate ferredoxin oxidoreductase alpha subunit
MRHELLLGDQAAARAAIDAGIGGAFSYPGTPATEIFECIEEYARRAGTAAPISALWSANEKVAYEEALGMSYAGRRALVSMKHVGLNVAADPFMSSAITGVNAGLVVIVADDPGMHSSQNEQDTRYYHEFAQLPLFEPANQQDSRTTQVLDAFEYSERGRPAGHRAHGDPPLPQPLERDDCARRRRQLAERGRTLTVLAGKSTPRVTGPEPNDWVLMPSNARRRYRRLLDLQPRLLRDSEDSRENRLRLAGPRGIIACGLASNYVDEVVR